MAVPSFELLINLLDHPRQISQRTGSSIYGWAVTLLSVALLPSDYRTRPWPRRLVDSMSSLPLPFFRAPTQPNAERNRLRNAPQRRPSKQRGKKPTLHTIAKNNALILMILKDKNVYANNARQTCPHSSDSGGWDHGWAGGLWS